MLESSPYRRTGDGGIDIRRWVTRSGGADSRAAYRRRISGGLAAWRLDGRGQGYAGKKARAVDGSRYDSAAARAGDHNSILALKPP